MTTRVPKGKGARTRTSTLVAALAADVQSAAHDLQMIAALYKSATDDELPALAARVDAALEFPIRVGAAWKRHKQVILHRTPQGVVYNAETLPPAKAVIIVGLRVAALKQNVRVLGRDPKDPRIHYVTGRLDCEKLYELDRYTPWHINHPTERDYNEIVRFLRHRFPNSKERNLADCISLLDWTNGQDQERD